MDNPSPATRPPVRRRRLLLGLLLVGVLLGAAGITWAVVRTRTALPAPPAVPDDAEPAVRAALQRMRQAVREAPRSAEAWGRLAQVFLANELEEEACLCAAVAQRLDPRNPRWPYYQGGVLVNQGERDKALPLLRRAADLDEGEGGQAPRLLLAETLLGLGRLDEAESELKAVQARQPQDVRLLFDLGLLAVARQDWGEARPRLLRCRNSPLSRQKALIQLSGVCLRLDDPGSAAKFRALADRLPRDADWSDPFVGEYLAFAIKKRSLYRRAEDLEAQGRYLEVAEVLRPLTEEYPDDDLAFLMRGKALAQAGKNDAAETYLRKALALAPGKVQAHHYLSLLLFRKGEAATKRGSASGETKPLFEEAIREARQALALKPDYGVAYMALGLALRQLGRKAEALEAFRQAVRCNPEHGELHYHLGVALAEAGQAAAARQRLRQALRFEAPGPGWVQAARDHLAELEKRSGAEGR